MVLNEERKNWSYFPIEHSEIEDMYQAQVAAFWTKGDLLFTDSVDDMALLDVAQEQLLHGVLAVFAQFDGLVSEKVDGFNEHPEVKKIKEAVRFFRAQNLIETIHGEVYGLMIIHYVSNENKRQELISAATSIPVVKKLADWMVKESNIDNLLKTIFVNALAEGVMFQGLFAIIFWFRRVYKGKFIGLTKGNELISRDEDLHATFALLLISVLRKKFEEAKTHTDWLEWLGDRTEVVRMVEELIEILTEFYEYFLPQQILDLNSQSLVDYTKVWANIVLLAVGHNPRYDVTNPLEFMDLTSMYRKTNFFEGKEVGYQKGLIHKQFLIDESLLE